MTQNVTLESGAFLSGVDEVVRALGGQTRMAAIVGRGRTSVANAVKRGRFPAAWIDRAEAALTARGYRVDRALFGLLPVAPPSDAPNSGAGL